jgi:RNase P/RNase MRP subunit p30
MKKTYADLHLLPDVKDKSQTVRMIAKASQLGYRQIAITFPAHVTKDDVEQIRSSCLESEIDLATRVDLTPRTPEELTRSLRKFRRQFEIVAVLSPSKNVARQAARDRRVDLLNFPSYDFRGRFFDMAEAELASTSLASLELDMKPLLTLEGAARARLLSSLRRETAIAHAFDVPIVISSGVSDEHLLRRPTELAALTSLFDLSKTLISDIISENPTAIIRRNRQKLDSHYVVPGIRVVRRGKDC